MKSLQMLLKSYKNADISIFCILAYFCPKMKNFTKNQLLCPGKCSILFHTSNFVKFRQLEGIFKSFQKILSAYLHFDKFRPFYTKFQPLIQLNTGENSLCDDVRPLNDPLSHVLCIFKKLAVVSNFFSLLRNIFCINHLIGLVFVPQ